MSHTSQILDSRDITRLVEIIPRFEIGIQLFEQLRQNGQLDSHIQELWQILDTRYNQLSTKIIKEEKLTTQNLLHLCMTLALDEKLKLSDTLCQFGPSKGITTCKEIELNHHFLAKVLEFKWPEYHALKLKLLDLFQ